MYCSFIFFRSPLKTIVIDNYVLAYYYEVDIDWCKQWVETKHVGQVEKKKDGSYHVTGYISSIIFFITGRPVVDKVSKQFLSLTWIMFFLWKNILLLGL